MRASFLVLACAITAAACARHDASGPGASSTVTTEAATILTDEFGRWRHDHYSFGSAVLHGNMLVVEIKHGGGCAQHEFALLVNPTFLESHPVRLHGSLAHDAKGDPCRALIMRTLRFDLSPIRDAFRAAYGTPSGVVHLHIEDWPAPLIYTF